MIPIMRPTLPDLSEYTALLEEIWASRMLSNFGPFVQRLEEQTRNYLGSHHASVVASGDTGLLVALRALQLPAGAPCFLPSFTFNSTVNAAIWNNLTPVFVDIDQATYTMCPQDLTRACASWGTRGVVLATHTFGNPCDHDRLLATAREHHHALVYDAAHGYGSARQGQQVGTLGDIEVFSLSGTKLVTSAEGGLVTTQDEELADRITYLRGYGFKHDYNSRFVGLNGKMSELHAAFGLLALAEVESAVDRRHRLVAAYRERLGSRVGWQLVEAGDRSTYKDVAVWVGTQRTHVEQSLDAAGVQTKRYFRPLHAMPAYRRWSTRPLPVTEATYAGLLCIPAYSDMSLEDVDTVCDVLSQALRRPVEHRSPRPSRQPVMSERNAVPLPRQPEQAGGAGVGGVTSEAPR